jgi:anthranilate synthase component 1
MMTPSYPEFKKLARRYSIVPVFSETLVDRETPVSVYERMAQDERYAFLLESVEGGERFGRYSFVGHQPHAVFSCREGRVTYRVGQREQQWDSKNPVQDLKKLFSEFTTAPVKGLPRFWGGAVGYWDYDTVRFFERLPGGQRDMLKLPTGAFQLTKNVIVFDRFSQTAKVIVNVFVPSGKRTESQLRALYDETKRSIDLQIRRIHLRVALPKRHAEGGGSEPKPLTSRRDYLNAVRKAQEYIRAGDIIQVVLSQRWELRPHASAFDVYRALRMVNPSPYMYFLHFPELDVVGSSPELLVRKEGTLAETRPIAGTRPRGQTAAEDARLAEELTKDPKERAEHLMLVDLGRNDLGRVCRPGSVRVPDLMTVENYSHVMHLVSSVVGTLRPNENAFDLFQASFPAGTVSGAPKIRAMQIIDELEPLRRGPYAGAVGYFSYDGNMDMAITIRTLVFTGGKAYMQAGAGIVADSDPAKEFAECEHKAAALFSAIAKTRDLQ